MQIAIVRHFCTFIQSGNDIISRISTSNQSESISMIRTYRCVKMCALWHGRINRVVSFLGVVEMNERAGNSQCVEVS